MEYKISLNQIFYLNLMPFTSYFSSTDLGNNNQDKVKFYINTHTIKICEVYDDVDNINVKRDSKEIMHLVADFKSHLEGDQKQSRIKWSALLSL